MYPELLLSIDAGTSRMRACMRSVEGEELAKSSTPMPQSENVEVIHASALWKMLVDAVNSLPPQNGVVVGICVAAFLGTIIVDGQGTALTPVVPWSDTRASVESDELWQILGDRGVETAGRPFTGELPAAKLRWFRSHSPEIFDAAESVLSVKDYLVMRLTGQITTDPTHASYSGMFDVRAGRYSRQLVRAAGIHERLLPPVRGAASSAGNLTHSARHELRLKGSTPIVVAVGGPDGTTGAVGSGAVVAGVTVDVAGTTDVLVATVDEPPPQIGARVILNRHAIEGLWTLGGATGMTGGAVDWGARLTGHRDVVTALDALGKDLLRRSSADAVFAPALVGSRFPAWSPNERAALFGLRAEHGPLEIFRAIIQGVAFCVREGIETLESLGVHASEIIVVGGSARRHDVLQLRSDAWQRPVRTVIDQDATLVGATMFAGMASRRYSNPEDSANQLIRFGRAIAPTFDTSSYYQDAFERWTKLSHVNRSI